MRSSSAMAEATDQPGKEPSGPPLPDTGLRLIITYKAAKAVGWPLLAGALYLGLHLHLDEHLQAGILRIHSHLSRQWTIELADWAMAAVTRRHIVMAIGALVLDGAVSGLEAWALHRRKPWGEWLVVVATASLMPFEVIRLLRKPKVGRVIVLVINLAVVLYLARRIRTEQRLKHDST